MFEQWLAQRDSRACHVDHDLPQPELHSARQCQQYMELGSCGFPPASRLRSCAILQSCWQHLRNLQASLLGRLLGRAGLQTGGQGVRTPASHPMGPHAPASHSTRGWRAVSHLIVNRGQSVTMLTPFALANASVSTFSVANCDERLDFLKPKEPTASGVGWRGARGGWEIEPLMGRNTCGQKYKRVREACACMPAVGMWVGVMVGGTNDREGILHVFAVRLG